LLAKAVALHQAGHTAEASKIYEQIIAQAPRQFDATHLLGVIALQDGRFEEAQSLITSALKINPSDPSAISNLGTVYLRRGDLDAAYDQFKRAVKLQPESVGSQTNLGMVLRQLDRSREALAPLRRAYSMDPESATVCNLLGACLLDTGDAVAAVKFFEAAARAEPGNPDGWANLAVALNSTGERERSLECASKAVAMNPGSSAAVASLAAVQFEKGEVETAIATYREAVALPNSSTQTHCAMANALMASGLTDEAIDHLRQAIAIDGNYAIARWKLAMAQIQPIYRDEAEIEKSRIAFCRCLDDLQTWFQAARRTEAHTAVASNQPFFVAYHPYNNRDLLSQYGKLCVEWMASMPSDGPVAKSKRLGSKMRIGIAGAHVRDSSVWNAITKGWIRHLDKSRFEIYLFHLGTISDDETNRARGDVTHFEDRPKNLQAWVEAISEANLDALIYPEIGMHPLTTQLASLRLAPVQAATWGHPETTGLPTMDVYLSADGLEPAEAQGNYSERLVRLPNLGVCSDPLTPSIEMPDLRSLGLPSDEPLLLCPGTPFKYSPLHDKVWARIAQGLPSGTAGRLWSRITKRSPPGGGGRLVFFHSASRSMDSLFEQRLRRAFDSERVDFDSRVCVIPNLPRPRFFGLLQHSALLLDTLVFSGYNTALQAIECGLPVLAREGDFMRGRLASGIMRRLGLPELVATTDEAFIEMAIRLAADSSKRKDLRLEIESRRHILFADTEPVRALERCLTEAIAQSRLKR
jgi:predicted O-linked N-acetylglucosamine transferase (SPINDLY family)